MEISRFWPPAWAIYPHRVQGKGMRGWRYIEGMENKLRKRIKIKKVLKRLAEEERDEGPSRKNYFPIVINCGRKTEIKPDYWEWGI